MKLVNGENFLLSNFTFKEMKRIVVHFYMKYYEPLFLIFEIHAIIASKTLIILIILFFDFFFQIETLFGLPSFSKLLHITPPMVLELAIKAFNAFQCSFVRLFQMLSHKCLARIIQLRIV